jgi:enoyl-[acyl-carrier protein] reductase I
MCESFYLTNEDIMTGLMAGKRGLIMGLANDKSLAWGIAKRLHAEGAELAFSYQGEVMEKRVRPLAAQLGCDFLIDRFCGSRDWLHQ